jgi:tetratricopeptide (TPR) repeat protein
MQEYKLATEYQCQAFDVLPNDHIETAVVYMAIASIIQDLGQFDSALEYYEKWLNLQKHLLPENHSNVGRTYTNMASMYIQMKNYEEECEYCNKALFLYRKALLSNHVDIQGINVVTIQIPEKLTFHFFLYQTEIKIQHRSSIKRDLKKYI